MLSVQILKRILLPGRFTNKGATVTFDFVQKLENSSSGILLI